MNKKIALFALLGTLNLAPAAFGQYFFITEKQQNFLQTSNSTVTADPDKTFRFQVQIGNNGNTTQDSNTPPPPNEFLKPGNATAISLNAPTGGEDDQWRYKQDFASQSLMDAVFPNGNYTLTIGGNTGNVPLTGDRYTNAPQASISVAGTWSGNTYTIFGGQNVVINTNSIAGFSSGNFRVGIDAEPFMGFSGNQSAITFDSFDGGLVDSSGNITIPASLLQAGQGWDVQLEFNAFSSFDQDSFPGNTSVGIYTVQTRFVVAAIPEPAETVLMVGSIALGLAVWRRQRKIAS